MKRYVQIFSLLLCAFFTKETLAIEEQDRFSHIEFDFAKLNITTQGFYDSKKEGEKSGLKAEMLARKNGLENITEYLKESCGTVNKEFLGTKHFWEVAFKSQGTEIYSNGILVLNLQAPYKSVLKIPTKLKRTLKTKDGSKLVFLLPSNIPASAVKCGSIEMVYGTDNRNRIHAVPGDIVREINSKSKLVKLEFNAAEGVLKTTSAEDEKLLINSTLLKDDNSPAEDSQETNTVGAVTQPSVAVENNHRKNDDHTKVIPITLFINESE